MDDLRVGFEYLRDTKTGYMTRLWFASDHYEPGSFLWICDHPELDAPAIRHGDEFDSAEIEVERVPDNRVRVHGFAVRGKTRNIGPSFAELDFECDLTDGAVTFFDCRAGQSYTLCLRFLGDRMVADEQGAFGYFGPGAHLGGEYHRPTSDVTSDTATPTFALQRLTIREKSAGEILANLKGITLSYQFREKVEELYRGRWTREPSWQVRVMGE